MKASWNTTLSFSIAMAFSFAFPHASAVDRSASACNFAYVTGGTTYEALTALPADRQACSFWCATAALHNCAHLADVKARITQTGTGKWAPRCETDGPWLFVALLAGHCLVGAIDRKGRGGRPDTQKFSTTVKASQHHHRISPPTTTTKLRLSTPATKWKSNGPAARRPQCRSQNETATRPQ